MMMTSVCEGGRIKEGGYVNMEAEEVSRFISRRHNAGSTWSVCASGSFRERIHDSFNWIGQMFILTVCVETGAERYNNLFVRLFRCQEAFYVWYDGSHDKSYAPAVEAFQALRGILETSEGILGAFADRLQTVKLLETDIDEIVSKIAEVHMHEGPPAIKTGQLAALLCQLHLIYIDGKI